MTKLLKLYFIFSILIFTGIAFSQTTERDVACTKAVYTFIDSYYNNKITSNSQAKELYDAMVNSLPEDFDEYQKNVHLARCEFYMGMFVMGEYDFSSVQQIKSMTDTDDNQKDLTEQEIAKKANAAAYFDRSISYAHKALAVHAGADAYLINAMAISSNCTVKKTSYVISNGLKVASLAKKALTLDPQNATACYYQYAQDLYAPAFFANYKRGYQKMYSFYTNETLRKEKNDIYFFLTGIAYSFYKTGNNTEAVNWYKKSLEIYPGNKFALNMIETLSK